MPSCTICWPTAEKHPRAVPPPLPWLVQTFDYFYIRDEVLGACHCAWVPFCRFRSRTLFVHLLVGHKVEGQLKQPAHIEEIVISDPEIMRGTLSLKALGFPWTW